MCFFIEFEKTLIESLNIKGPALNPIFPPPPRALAPLYIFDRIRSLAKPRSRSTRECNITNTCNASMLLKFLVYRVREDSRYEDLIFHKSCFFINSAYYFFLFFREKKTKKENHPKYRVIGNRILVNNWTQFEIIFEWKSHVRKSWKKYVILRFRIKLTQRVGTAFIWFVFCSLCQVNSHKIYRIN